MVRNSRQWGQKQRKIFGQRSPDRSQDSIFCLFVNYIFIYLFLCLFACLFIDLSCMYMFVHLLFFYIVIYLSIYLFYPIMRTTVCFRLNNPK